MDWPAAIGFGSTEGSNALHFDQRVVVVTGAANGIGRLVVSGAQSDGCIRCTIHGAFARGYDVTLAADAHTTEDLSQWGAPTPDLVVAHTNLYWQFQTAPGRTALVARTHEVKFAG